jgi:hypothetical protein
LSAVAGDLQFFPKTAGIVHLSGYAVSISRGCPVQALLGRGFSAGGILDSEPARHFALSTWLSSRAERGICSSNLAGWCPISRVFCETWVPRLPIPFESSAKLAPVRYAGLPRLILRTRDWLQHYASTTTGKAIHSSIVPLNSSHERLGPCVGVVRLTLRWVA